MRRRVWVSVISALLFLTACGDQGVPAEKAAVIGVVTEVEERGFLLQAEQDLIQSGAEYFVDITDGTGIYRQEDKKATQAGVEEIREQMRLSIWIEGDVRESSPPQITARVILIQGQK